MATDLGFVQYVNEQSGLGAALTHRRMFGEYALYLHGRVVAFACDNQLFLKPTEVGRRMLGTVTELPAYPGSKLYFRLLDELEDRALLQQVLVATADALPLPKPKAARVAKPSRR